MALIKYAPLAQEVAGTVGGVTFARVHSAKIVRGWRRPPYKNTTHQIAQRNLHSRATQRWFNVLSAADRLSWDLYAPTCSFTNSLGDTYFLTGFNMFVRNQTLLFKFFDYSATAAPVFDGFPIISSLGLIFTHATGVLTLNSWAPTPPTTDSLMFGIFQFLRVTRNQLGPTLNQTINVICDQFPPFTIYTYPSPPPLTAGQLAAGCTWYQIDEYQRISKQQTARTPSS